MSQVLTCPSALWLGLHLTDDFKKAVSVQGKGWLALTIQGHEKRAVTMIPETATPRECFEAWNTLVFESFVEPAMRENAVRDA